MTAALGYEPLLSAPLNTTFIHRQTLANQVRFTTAELADLDGRIAQAGARALAIELETFETLREAARASATAIQSAADALAALDVSAALAMWAGWLVASRRAGCSVPLAWRSAWAKSRSRAR